MFVSTAHTPEFFRESSGGQNFSLADGGGQPSEARINYATCRFDLLITLRGWYENWYDFCARIGVKEVGVGCRRLG